MSAVASKEANHRLGIRTNWLDHLQPKHLENPVSAVTSPNLNEPKAYDSTWPQGIPILRSVASHDCRTPPTPQEGFVTITVSEAKSHLCDDLGCQWHA